MDLNGDGNQDVLSGSWPGEIFLFKGRADGSFEPREMIKDRDGEYINIGGGVKKETMFYPPGGDQPEGLLITGFADFENTEEGTFVNFHGRRYESTKDRPVAITGSASTVHPGDFDGDGDYDLIVGTINGGVYLIPNEGTAKKYAFGKEIALKAGGKEMNVGGRAGPYAADWDGDGDLDLLVGAEDGSVNLFENIGDAKVPEFAKAVELLGPGRSSNAQDPPSDVQRGTRSKVCAVDFNDDGLVDLLVGDLGYLKPDVPEPGEQEKAENQRIQKELDEVTETWRQIAQKLYDREKKLSQEQIDEYEAQRDKLYSKMSELRKKLPVKYETHGWVWLFLRQRR